MSLREPEGRGDLGMSVIQGFGDSFATLVLTLRVDPLQSWRGGVSRRGDLGTTVIQGFGDCFVTLSVTWGVISWIYAIDGS